MMNDELKSVDLLRKSLGPGAKASDLAGNIFDNSNFRERSSFFDSSFRIRQPQFPCPAAFPDGSV
jgi:hypothetical protein